MDFNSYKNCLLCPRECGVDRTKNHKGICGETVALRIASIGPHYGEEPPISGTNGSGTVFFSGCSLRCIYCQNYQISIDGIGEKWEIDKVVEAIRLMYIHHHIHNVNFVTPDHFFPHTIEIVKGLRKKGIKIPILYNTSGYQKISSLRAIEPYADIYMPDFKYLDRKLSAQLSHCENYPDVALNAIYEMVKQKGFLDTKASRSKPAKKGVLVRHLILPGNVENSTKALILLFAEFGENIPISLMSQYFPARRHEVEFLNRRIRNEEFRQVYDYACSLGFTNMYVQFPSFFNTEKDKTDFVPDFKKKKPFKGN
jgi:putative pyruvate formate lyase activating enzyme